MGPRKMRMNRLYPALIWAVTVTAHLDVELGEVHPCSQTGMLARV